MITRILTGVVVLSSASLVLAEPQVYRGDNGPTRHAYVVIRDVVAPAAVVSRKLDEQPVRPWLVEVRLVNSVVYMDPDVDYISSKNGNRIDENHSLLKAQRLARVLRDPGVQVIYGSQAHHPMAAMPITPHMILMKPGIPKPQGPNEMPQVPSNEEKKTGEKMVSAQ